MFPATNINSLFARRAIIPALLMVAFGFAGITRPLGEPFDPDGAFWIRGTPPHDFEDFSAINLNTRHNPHFPRPGVDLTNGMKFSFRSVSVTRERLTFRTVIVKGVSYSFTGRFLRGGVFAAATLDDQTPVLEGSLTKFKNGEKVATANLKFTYFGGT